MKKICSLLAVFVLIGAGVYAEKIVIGAQDAPPVFDPKADNRGMLGQMLTAVFKGSGFDVDYKLVPAVRALAMTDDGDLTGGFVGGNMDNSKGKYKLRNLFNMFGLFFYKKSAFPNGVTFSTLDDLKQYKIGIWT